MGGAAHHPQDHQSSAKEDRLNIDESQLQNAIQEGKNTGDQEDAAPCDPFHLDHVTRDLLHAEGQVGGEGEVPSHCVPYLIDGHLVHRGDKVQQSQNPGEHV